MNSNYILLAILMVLILAAGFMLGRFSSFGSSYVDNSEVTNTSNPNGAANNGEATTVPSSNLTEDQKKMLSSFGIDPNTVTITPEMIACAEGKLGQARIEEIKNGATPSFTEGVSLAACYR